MLKADKVFLEDRI